MLLPERLAPATCRRRDRDGRATLKVAARLRVCLVQTVMLDVLPLPEDPSVQRRRDQRHNKVKRDKEKPRERVLRPDGSMCSEVTRE